MLKVVIFCCLTYSFIEITYFNNTLNQTLVKNLPNNPNYIPML